MPSTATTFNLSDHCHVNQNGNEDRFVGIKADAHTATICFPMGYDLPSNEGELRSDIRNLINILATFTDKSERTFANKNKSSFAQAVEFPIYAYLNIINHYLDHNGNYYCEKEVQHTISQRGKVDWGRTIRSQTPMLQGTSPVYLNQVVRVTSFDTDRLITQIHRYCVYESFNRIGWLFTSFKPNIPDIHFDKPLFLSVLNSKLHSTNNDADKELFRSMIALIEFKDYNSNEMQFCFGTDRFEIVWERLIDRVFGVTNKNDYFPHARWKQRYGESKFRSTSALEPDTIMKYNQKLYVLDAKYYRYGILPHLGISALPPSSDINKQITYGQFVKNNRAPDGAEVYNAFIMPYNRSQNDFGISSLCGNVGEATGDWISKPRPHEQVQGIVLDTRYLMRNYDGRLDEICAELREAIETPERMSNCHNATPAIN